MQSDPNGLISLLEPQIEALGYELVLIEHTQDQNGAVVRIYIDAPGGILLEDCEQVSRQVSLVMDLEEPIRGAYNLEVTSPGDDRPLTKLSHFKTYQGEEIKVLTHDYVLGRRRFKGVLEEVSNNLIVVIVDNEAYEIELEQIESARIVPNYDD
ncbi:MAG: ribosome maturation factor RimP [Saprospiraceae bacterium]|jgi:ribosome maturation factor RimP